MGIVAIVQAHMGSRRLPGKILKNIEGKAMLHHVVNRLAYSSIIEKIVVAASLNKKDDIIEGFCRKNSIDCCRGSEEDVLDRYYEAAKLYKADVVVRITSDCPLIDPCVSDRIIQAYLKNITYFDGATNAINRTYPRGLDTEVFPFSILKQLWEKADKPYQREHATRYVYDHPELFNFYNAENKEDLSDLRWTVDEEDDLNFVKAVYKRLYKEGEMFFMDDILGILKKEPSLLEINKCVPQKTIKR